MKASSPPKSKHILGLEGLRSPEVTFWCVWGNGYVIACGALKELDEEW